MTEKTFVPTLALLAGMAISIALTTTFATDRHHNRAAMGLAGEMVDAALHERVETLLHSDPGMLGSRIAVMARSGIVELEGRVPDDQTLDRALELASGVRGVREVHSSLVVGLSE